MVAAPTDVRSGVGASDDWGLRFFARTDEASEITFDFVATPAPDDILAGSSAMWSYVEAVDYDDGERYRPARDPAAPCYRRRVAA